MTRRTRRRRRIAAPLHDSAPSERHRLRSFGPWIALLAGAATLRLLIAAQLWDLPLVRTPKLDSAEYLSWASRLAAGDFSWPIVSAHGPGYPVFLAAVLNLFNGSLHGVLIV